MMELDGLRFILVLVGKGGVPPRRVFWKRGWNVLKIRQLSFCERKRGGNSMEVKEIKEVKGVKERRRTLGAVWCGWDR